MRPTLPALAKASRLPLTSKRANKNFYKGVGSSPANLFGAGNLLKKERIALVTRTDGKPLKDAKTGLQRTWNKRVGGRLDESKMTCFVVPPGLRDTNLRPYVFTGPVSDEGSPWPARGYPSGPRMRTFQPASSSSSSSSKPSSSASKSSAPSSKSASAASPSSKAPPRATATGLDGRYYASLVDAIEARRLRRREVQGDVQIARAASASAKRRGASSAEQSASAGGSGSA